MRWIVEFFDRESALHACRQRNQALENELADLERKYHLVDKFHRDRRDEEQQRTSERFQSHGGEVARLGMIIAAKQAQIDDLLEQRRNWLKN